MAKSKPAPRPRPLPRATFQPRVTREGSISSISAAGHVGNQRRAQEKLADLERENRACREREAQAGAQMSKLEDSISDLGNLVRVLEARVDVRLNASRLQESTESQDLAQRRLAHLERQNMELRHRETESRAQIASWTASYTREYHSSRAHEAKLQADTYSWNRMQSFLLFKLAQAVAWNRLHYRDVIPGREFHSLGPGLVTDVKLDGGELDWTEMETWMSRFPHQVRGACGEQVVERLEELIRGFHERRYGMMPEEEYEEEWYQNEEDDDLGSGEDDEGQAEEEDDEEEEQ